jgi:hypothetical protein
MPRTSTKRKSRSTAPGTTGVVDPTPPSLRFDQKLILFQWLMGLFEAERFEVLAEPLKAGDYEGFDENNISRFHHVLNARLFDRSELPPDVLLGYDQNIVRHWQDITRTRNESQALFPKYFQYLSLLFAEIYLDRYFSDAHRLLNDLNLKVKEFNEGKDEEDQLPPYTADQLNKLAFWNATGSGKTLLMHVNILQYRYYLDLYGRTRDLNRIILLTPNEGLSRQHLEEFERSGVEAELFSKDGRGLFAGKSAEIIDVHKLRDESKEKTVDVDAFENNNLVLVDEGHRGAGGDEWMSRRNKLCSEGFSFEYSATFGQAMKAARRPALTAEYAKCILFDYSYKYFYKDGYGKDYHILNLEDDTQDDARQLYLTACLMVFYQQQRIFRDNRAAFTPYLLEAPLWVFVGGSVNAVRTQAGEKVSDVVDILLFLSRFIQKREKSIGLIERLLAGHGDLLDNGGRQIFANKFGYLVSTGLSGEEIFSDILKTLFNAPAPAKLHVENLKGSDGEIALRIGDANEEFGLINVGDAANLCKLCEQFDDLAVDDREFSGSLFRAISAPASPINLLIGSKKFTEGWNSWRVATMGLMNVGRSEGSEVIQLFGRGVRLKGLNFCLKRTRHLQGIKAPKHIEALETLNIFGIRADYMRQFKEYLEEEGLPANEQRVEFVLPVLKNLGTKKLTTLRLKDDTDFKRLGTKPNFGEMPEDLRGKPITLDWYPKVQSRVSSGLKSYADVAEKHEAKLAEGHLAFVDMSAIFFEMVRFKNERFWYNLNISKAGIANLLAKPDWYCLYIPKEMLEFDSFERVRMWQEIAIALLKKFCDKFYKHEKARYEAPNLEYRELSETDPNFLDEYRFLLDESETTILETLKQLKEAIEKKELKEVELGNLRCIIFGQHLYQPLIYLNSTKVEVKPVSLNEGERDFVLDLKAFHTKETAFFEGRELYLLRNQSRGRGIGFFEAGNFYPDFILWLIDKNKQYVSFVDPKGIRNLEGEGDPKIDFYRTIKDLETRMADPKVILNSFILANTRFDSISWWGKSKQELEDRHVVFQEDGGAVYIKKILDRILK